MASSDDGYQEDVEGWLNIWEVAHRNQVRPSFDGYVPVIIWEPWFCVILKNKKRLVHFRTEKQTDEIYHTGTQKVVRLDNGKDHFDKQWGYFTLDAIKENVLHQYDIVSGTHDQDVHVDGGDRRSSIPYMFDDDEANDTASTPAKIANFFTRRVKSNLKRTKSVTKLDPQKVAIQEQDRNLLNSRIRASQSHESLLQINAQSSMHSIDLSAADIEIKPVHSSILGQEHCFQVSSSNGSKFYSCRSAQECQKWIQHLRKTVEPSQEQTRRMVNTLQIFIQEAKNLPAKKRYYCEICLDNILYARTSTKLKGEMLFWGEHFNFSDLPPADNIIINLYKEADKRKKKERNQLLAYTNIVVTDVTKQHLVESWYPASSAIVGKAGKDNKSDQPLLRIKARYQTVQILPMHMYVDFMQYLKTNYMSLVDVLEPQISVKSKEEIATVLVKIFHQEGSAGCFLSDVVTIELGKLDNNSLTFRGNSIATKAVEAYLKLVGDKYLRNTLGDFIKTVTESADDCEVDPIRVQNQMLLQKHQQTLRTLCEMAWFKIVNSHSLIPSELCSAFASFRQCCEEHNRTDTADNLISSCIFLRFLCPAILSPSLFNLIQEFPDERAARNLTLVAKTIQCLANFTKFGAKEEFMIFMNEFVEQEESNMRMFIQQISNTTQEVTPEFDAYIDLGKELSVAHSLLAEHMCKVPASSVEQLNKLQDILEDVTYLVSNPEASRKQVECVIYDNLIQSDKLLQTVYTDADLSNSSEFSLQQADSCLPEVLLTSTGRLRVGITEPAQDGKMYAQWETSPLESGSPVSPSTFSHTQPEEEQVNLCWNKMVRAAEGDHMDLVSFADAGKSSKSKDLSNEQIKSQPSSSDGSNQYQQPLSFSNPLFDHSETKAGELHPSLDQFRDPYQSPCSFSSDEEHSHTTFTGKQSELASSHHPQMNPATPGHHRQRRINSDNDGSPTLHDDDLPLQRNRFQDIELLRHRDVSTPPLKRTITDSMIHENLVERNKSPERLSSRTLPTSWKSMFTTKLLQPTNQRHSKDSPGVDGDDKSKEQYEKELSTLREQLAQTQSMLAETQDKLDEEETQRQLMETQMCQSMDGSEATLAQRVDNKQDQIHSIIAKLNCVEEMRQNEQRKLQVSMSRKKQIIAEQSDRIVSLDHANTKLMSALNQLRDRCHVFGRIDSQHVPCVPLDHTSDNDSKISFC